MAFRLKNRCCTNLLLSLVAILLSLQGINCVSPVTEEGADPDLDLRLVQVIARHAVRAPEYPYPNDPFKDELKYWPNGWGQITELGKQQAFQLGQFFRRRYEFYLSPKYTEKETFVLSSGYDRSILSAQLAMAGLYAVNESGLTEKPTWQQALFYSAVPVHTLPRSTDRMIQPHQQCPRLKLLHNETSTSNPEVLAHQKRYKEIFQNLAENMGYPPGSRDAWVGTLAIENMYNLSIPTWAKVVLGSKEQMDAFFWLFKTSSLTPEQRRLGTGPILTELMKNMENKISGNETRKFFFYSGHDIIIANILNTLDMFEVHMPDFSSCLIFELYFRNSTQEYILKLFYKYSQLDDLKDLKIPNCTSPVAHSFNFSDSNETDCKLTSFRRIVQPYMIKNLDSECALKSVVEEYIGISVLDAILIGVIILVSLVFLGTEFYHCSKNRKSLSNNGKNYWNNPRIS